MPPPSFSGHATALVVVVVVVVVVEVVYNTLCSHRLCLLNETQQASVSYTSDFIDIIYTLSC